LGHRRGGDSVSAVDADICVIEDDPQQLRLLVAQLESIGHSVVHANDAEFGLRMIYSRRPKIVICDIVLPGINGIQLCRQLRADPTLDGTYVLLLTGGDVEGRKNRAYSAGADDYIFKPYDLETLRARIRSGLRFHKLQERLRQAAITDNLTGLWNHGEFRTLLEREFQRTRRYGTPVALLMCDLDHFKAINDSLGHEIGNQVLKQTAQHLRCVARDTDLVARYGGEEFAIICPQTSLADAAALAERIRCSLPAGIRIPSAPHLAVKISIGVAGSDDPRVDSVRDLVNLADSALYASKRGGRNRVTTSSSVPAEPVPCGPEADELDRLRKEVFSLSLQSKELCLQSIWALIQALEARDGYSAWHSRNVTQYTRWLLDFAGWAPRMADATTNAAMLHDLGKIGVPDDLLRKPQALTQSEAAIVRQVPLITCRILEPLRVFETEVLIVRHLREWFDGTGYPDGLVGTAIPTGSRLLAVAEAFDSLTCNRAYRMGLSLGEAVEVIRATSGRQFDPEFVQLLVDEVAANEKRWQCQIERARVQMPAGQGERLEPAIA
jgi:diguanylate cyclase (GGDEF)-like protein